MGQTRLLPKNNGETTVSTWRASPVPLMKDSHDIRNTDTAYVVRAYGGARVQWPAIE